MIPLNLLLLVLVLCVCASSARAQPVQWPVSQGGNGHYYDYVSGSYDWNAAQAAAASMSSGGQAGYLVTITSSAENAFLLSQFGSIAGGGVWIGATDAAVEGEWRWVTGPETGTQFWQGAVSGFATPPYYFAQWGSSEPNDGLVGEDYAYFVVATNPYGAPGEWVDNVVSGGSAVNGMVGFLVEWSLPSAPDYQTNNVFSNLLVNGVTGTPYAPATVTIPISAPAMLQFSSLNTGMPWELGYGLAPLVPASAGGLTTAGGQILNLDLTDPTFGVLWNYFNSPGFVNATIPFSVANPANVSMQMLVVAPTLLDGVAISQPTRLTVQ